MCRLFVSSSKGLREIKPRQRPPAYRLTGFYATPEAQQVYYQQTTDAHTQPTIHPLNHPSAHSPKHPFTHPSIHPPISSSIHPPIHPPIPIHPNNPPSIHLSIHHPSVRPNASHQSAESSPPTTGSYRNTIIPQRLCLHDSNFMTHLQYKVRNYPILWWTSFVGTALTYRPMHNKETTCSGLKLPDQQQTLLAYC